MNYQISGGHGRVAPYGRVYQPEGAEEPLQLQLYPMSDLGLCLFLGAVEVRVLRDVLDDALSAFEHAEKRQVGKPLAASGQAQF